MTQLRKLAAFLLGLSVAFYTISFMGLSVGFLAAVFYVVLLFQDISRINKISRLYGNAYLFPLFFLVLLLLVNMIYSRDSLAVFPKTIVLNWLLFLFILLHSTRDNKASRIVLYGYSLGVFMLSILFYLGVGVDFFVTREGDRFTILGMNSNILGIMLSFGVSIVLNLLIIDNALQLKTFRFIFFIPIVLMMGVILATGSRTAFLISVLIFAFSIFYTPVKKKINKYFMIACGVVAFIWGIHWFLSSDTTMLSRIMTTIIDGDTSSRVDIWVKYLSAVNHPIFGVGQTGMNTIAQEINLTNSYYGGSLSSTAYSPHNVLVEVFIMTGLVGLSLLLVFLYHSVCSATRSYKHFGLITPLSLLIPLLIIILSGQMLTEKYAWIALAYIIASSESKKLS